MGADRSSGETRALADGAPKSRVVEQFRLQVLDGPDAGQSAVSRQDRLIVGSHESCDLCLSDDTVSRFHCELVAQPGYVEVRDLGSRNDTVVDGVAVWHARLHPGALLTLGQTIVRFDLEHELTELPLYDGAELGSMVGVSPAIRSVFEVIRRCAPTGATVLLEGETGTGKEAAAETLHQLSGRGGDLLVVDCGAIPSDLLESELFGHRRGAFTGATEDRAGAFAEAEGGTLFLDEIGELSPSLQPALLRALEKREVKPVGESRYRPVDVRVVAATNRDLKKEVNAGQFRADLYYRLAVVRIELPPLRDRPEDIPLLVERFLDQVDPALADRTAFADDPELAAELRRHSWPGNARELRNYLDRCIALAELQPLADEGPTPQSGLPSVDLSRPLKEARTAWTRAFERRYLSGLLDRHGGNVTAAARAAGIDRIYFHRLMRRCGLRRGGS